MNRFNLMTLMLFALGVLSSCLPQEKTTQCGKDQAFNATQRRCVASVSKSTDSISIANVTPASSYSVSISDPSRTHAVTISDPFHIGYSLRWNVTYPSGSTLLVATGSTYTFNHSSFPTGSYILEVQVFNSAGSEILDSRSWTVNVLSQTVPSITTTTPTPFGTTISSVPTSISTTASNPDLISNVNYQWFVNGNPVAGESGSFSTSSRSINFNFNPQSSSTYFVGAGVYSVQLSLTENGSGLLYTTYTWSVSNNIPGFSTVSLGTANNGPATGNQTPSPAAIVTALDEMSITAGGFKNDLNGDGTLDSIDFCVRAADVSGVDGNGVFVDFLENGVAIPNGVGIQLTMNNTSFCLGDAILAASASYSMDIPTLLQTESRTVTAVVYDGFSGQSTNPTYNGATELKRYNWTTRVRQLNTAPIIEIDAANTSLPGGCTSASPTSMAGCTITQDETFNIAITVTDDDYNPHDFTSEFQYFRVQFYLDGVLLDGSHALSSNDCFEDFSETPNSTRYICTMDINPYDTNGPIDPTGRSYTLTAVVEDSQSPYTFMGSPASNTVTWSISTVLPAVDTGALINAFDETAAVPPTATESYISEQATPGTAIDLNTNANILAPQVAEGDNIIFNISVDDIERDSHFIKIFRCDDKTMACSSPVAVATRNVISTSDLNPKRTAITVQISEDSVKNNDVDFVFYRVVVRKDSSVAAPDLDSETVYLSVQNTNPNPVFDTDNFNPALNTAGTPLIAYAGMPITFDPGAITDASLLDGEQITYQWMVSINSGAYAPIDGATSRVLTWTPGSEIDFLAQTGTPVTVKLCMGDNGWDNAFDVAKTPMNAANNNCLNPTLDSGEWFISAFSNMQIGQTYNDNTSANVGNGEAAVWIDQSSVSPLVKYMAYVTINKDIVVEKIVTLPTGGKGGSTEQAVQEISSIVFSSTTDASYSLNDVTNLSIAGDSTNKALYLAYMSPVSGIDLVHIRRIDISGGKTNPALLHDGKFSWDSGYDDLLDNSAPGAGLSEAINAVTGELEITVTSDANTTPTMNFSISNLHGGVSTLNAGTQFCAPVSLCSTLNTTATNLAAAINDTLLEEFQGLTATAAGSVVTISGVIDRDFIQADIGATSIGKIMVNKSTGRWELPLIDNDQSGGNKSKIAIYSGNLASRLDGVAASKSLLPATVPSQEIVNAIYKSDKNGDAVPEGNDRILIVTRALGSGQTALHEYDAFYNLDDVTTDLFADSINGTVYDLKVAISQNTTNSSAYVMGRNQSGGFAYARINHASGDFDFSTITLAVDLDNDFQLIENGNASFYDIAAGPLANQLFMSIVDSINGDAYLLNITGALPSMDCSFDKDQTISKCMKIQTTTADTIFSLPVALGEVVENVTLSDAGAVALENQTHILPMVYHIDDGGGIITDDALPVLGVLNVKAINLSGDQTAPGLKYNIPYIND